MADSKPDKPGFFSRLFGRPVDDEAKPAEPSVVETPVPTEPGPGSPGSISATRSPIRRCPSRSPRPCRRRWRRRPWPRSSRGPIFSPSRSLSERGPRPPRAGPARPDAAGRRSAKLVAAPLPRHEADLVLPVGERHRALHQAQARPRHAGGAGRRAGTGRSRGRHGACASPRRSRPAATTRRSPPRR